MHINTITMEEKNHKELNNQRDTLAQEARSILFIGISATLTLRMINVEVISSFVSVRVGRI